MKSIASVFMVILFAQTSFAQNVRELTDEQLTNVQNKLAWNCTGKKVIVPVSAVGESLPGVKLFMDISSGAILKEGNGGFVIVGRVASGIVGGVVSTVISEAALAVANGFMRVAGAIADVATDITGTGWRGASERQTIRELDATMVDAPGAIYNNTVNTSHGIQNSNSCKNLELVQAEVGRRAADLARSESTRTDLSLQIEP